MQFQMLLLYSILTYQASGRFLLVLVDFVCALYRDCRAVQVELGFHDNLLEHLFLKSLGSGVWRVFEHWLEYKT